MWLVADEVWVSFISFQVFFVQVENRNNLQLFYVFIYKICTVLFDKESLYLLPKIRLRVCFPDARSPHPCVLISEFLVYVTKAFLQSIRMVISTDVKGDEKERRAIQVSKKGLRKPYSLSKYVDM
jgi:hypothetical protein